MPIFKFGLLTYLFYILQIQIILGYFIKHKSMKICTSVNIFVHLYIIYIGFSHFPLRKKCRGVLDLHFYFILYHKLKFQLLYSLKQNMLGIRGRPQQ